MILNQLRLHGFRSHTERSLDFGQKVNLIVGPNGAGKTNVLEAIHYLCLSKSFLTAQDKVALRHQAMHFEVEGRLCGAHRSELTLRLAYVPDEGKRMFANGAPLERLADVVGMVPVVIASPQDHALTAEGPEHRRRYLDNILSQARPVYLDDLLKYRRALRQRNALLQQQRRAPHGTNDVLDSWTNELVLRGARVIAGRLRFIQAFHAYLHEAFAHLHITADQPGMRYRSIDTLAEGMNDKAITSLFQNRLRAASPRERELGRTVVGPHRDELIFKLNGFDVRRYASQGQHRTFGLALQLAKYFFLKDQLDEYPILLLDDVFGNLDAARRTVILQLLRSDQIGQSIVTATDSSFADEVIDLTDTRNRVIILDGEA